MERSLSVLKKQEVEKLANNLESILHEARMNHNLELARKSLYCALIGLSVVVPSAILGGSAFVLTYLSEHIPRKDLSHAVTAILIVDTTAFLAIKDTIFGAAKGAYRGLKVSNQELSKYREKITGIEQELNEVRQYL
ncbi:MAG: hypothetical protein AABW88_03940 [Nanoarchaeota archaeon]